jgi:hypothetical protein
MMSILTRRLMAPTVETGRWTHRSTTAVAIFHDEGTVMVWTDAEREWMMRDEPGAVRCPAAYNYLRRHRPKPDEILCCLMRVDHPGRHIAIADRRWPQQVEEPGLRTASGLPITDEFVAGMRAVVRDRDFQARLRHARERNREALGLLR